MARRGRPQSRNVAAARSSRRTSTPVVAPVDSDVDELMQEPDDAATPDENDDADEVGTPADASQQADDEEPSNPPTPLHPVPPPRRRGRPPRVRPDGWEAPPQDDASDSATPRRRGRGGWRGGRGRGRGSRSAQTSMRVPVDKEGNTMEVVNDEVAVPEDAEGETKVDKNGELQGGREYRVRTFTLAGRGDRLYMLSTEPARCTGFRDSYLFFTKHMFLYKIIIDDDEKRDLIDRDLIPHSYKGRSIGVVTARSVFREFGARIIVGGKKVVDDYNVTEAKTRGEVEGELVDPFDKLPEKGQEYNRNQYVAWHGASSVYHDKPAIPMQNGKPILGKRKITITSANWMLEHAREASRFNAALAAERRAVSNGAYDPHTNKIFYPKAMQPTHARWEHLPSTADDEPPAKKRRVNGTLTNGDVVMINGDSHVKDTAPSFPAVSDVIARNFLVIDSYFQSPPHAAWAPPGPSPYTDAEHERFDIPRPGLPILTEEELNDLPEECRQALQHSSREEDKWKSSWSTESHDGGRAKLRIGVGPA
ncbi:hypothetical protein FH972_021813 [Carpinus fangiana]|uniref:Uncharacterized protein n=1 Tax=Carpinus fangiana TaxID=176857 RepID=A0A5N6KQZ8_9ROSI|nr:hypothetical protein FH972_021813 [Carpinus fangiana]